MLVRWLVGQSVGWSVGPVFTFLAFFSFLSLLLLPKCSSDLLQRCSCPPVRDWGSRVSGLVFFFFDERRDICSNDLFVWLVPAQRHRLYRRNENLFFIIFTDATKTCSLSSLPTQQKLVFHHLCTPRSADRVVTLWPDVWDESDTNNSFFTSNEFCNPLFGIKDGWFNIRYWIKRNEY